MQYSEYYQRLRLYAARHPGSWQTATREELEQFVQKEDEVNLNESDHSRRMCNITDFSFYL